MYREKLSVVVGNQKQEWKLLKSKNENSLLTHLHGDKEEEEDEQKVKQERREGLSYQQLQAPTQTFLLENLDSLSHSLRALQIAHQSEWIVF